MDPNAKAYNVTRAQAKLSEAANTLREISNLPADGMTIGQAADIASRAQLAHRLCNGDIGIDSQTVTLTTSKDEVSK